MNYGQFFRPEVVIAVIVAWICLIFFANHAGKKKRIAESTKVQSRNAEVIGKRPPRAFLSSSRRYQVRLQLTTANYTYLRWWQDVKKEVYDHAVRGDFIANPLYEDPAVAEQSLSQVVA